MILSEMYYRQRILQFFKNGMMTKGHSYKELSWIIGQLDLLQKLIDQESFDMLNGLLRKTNFRLLKSIDKGGNNIVEIYDNPYDWKLGKIEDNTQEWLNPEALIFSTERQTLVFSKEIAGLRYINNKWQ